MQVGRNRRVEDGFDHEHEFVAAFPAEDHRWGVFGAWRDIAHLSNKRGGHAIYRHASRVAVLNRTYPCFRNEGADFDILRWQQYDNWFSGSDPLPLSKQCVVNQTGLRSEEHTSELQSRFDLVCRL